ncbi:hypothetical protein WICPIJ_000335, partial [Wickerhamomyces pijperi]
LELSDKVPSDRLKFEELHAPITLRSRNIVIYSQAVYIDGIVVGLGAGATAEEATQRAAFNAIHCSDVFSCDYEDEELPCFEDNGIKEGGGKRLRYLQRRILKNLRRKVLNVGFWESFIDLRTFEPNLMGPNEVTNSYTGSNHSSTINTPVHNQGSASNMNEAEDKHQGPERTPTSDFAGEAEVLDSSIMEARIESEENQLEVTEHHTDTEAQSEDETYHDNTTKDYESTFIIEDYDEDYGSYNENSDDGSVYEDDSSGEDELRDVYETNRFLKDLIPENSLILPIYTGSAQDENQYETSGLKASPKKKTKSSKDKKQDGPSGNNSEKSPKSKETGEVSRKSVKKKLATASTGSNQDQSAPKKPKATKARSVISSKSVDQERENEEPRDVENGYISDSKSGSSIYTDGKSNTNSRRNSIISNFGAQASHGSNVPSAAHSPAPILQDPIIESKKYSNPSSDDELPLKKEEPGQAPDWQNGNKMDDGDFANFYDDAATNSISESTNDTANSNSNDNGVKREITHDDGPELLSFDVPNDYNSSSATPPDSSSSSVPSRSTNATSRRTKKPSKVTAKTKPAAVANNKTAPANTALTTTNTASKSTEKDIEMMLIRERDPNFDHMVSKVPFVSYISSRKKRALDDSQPVATNNSSGSLKSPVQFQQSIPFESLPPIKKRSVKFVESSPEALPPPHPSRIISKNQYIPSPPPGPPPKTDPIEQLLARHDLAPNAFYLGIEPAQKGSPSHLINMSRLISEIFDANGLNDSFLAKEIVKNFGSAAMANVVIKSNFQNIYKPQSSYYTGDSSDLKVLQYRLNLVFNGELIYLQFCPDDESFILNGVQMYTCVVMFREVIIGVSIGPHSFKQATLNAAYNIVYQSDVFSRFGDIHRVDNMLSPLSEHRLQKVFEFLSLMIQHGGISNDFELFESRSLNKVTFDKSKSGLDIIREIQTCGLPFTCSYANDPILREIGRIQGNRSVLEAFNDLTEHFINPAGKRYYNQGAAVVPVNTNPSSYLMKQCEDQYQHSPTFGVFRDPFKYNGKIAFISFLCINRILISIGGSFISQEDADVHAAIAALNNDRGVAGLKEKIAQLTANRSKNDSETVGRIKNNPLGFIAPVLRRCILKSYWAQNGLDAYFYAKH